MRDKTRTIRSDRSTLSIGQRGARRARQRLPDDLTGEVSCDSGDSMYA